MDIQLKEAENAGGIDELRQELDRNPLGEKGPLMKAESNSSWRAPVTGIGSSSSHPQYHLPENSAPMGKNAWGRPLADYVVVLQDRYRDELQCKKCSGRGYGRIQCRLCGGTGRDTNRGETSPCPDCKSSDFDSPAMPKSTGFLPCNECRGTGQAVAGMTGIVSTTDHQKEPSTGVVRALGKSVTEFNLGDRILYSQFAGVSYECEGRTWRVIKQSYPIMRIFGDGDVKTREGI